MKLKADILGTCNTQGKFDDEKIKWDRLPYELMYDRDKKRKPGEVVICNYLDGVKLFIACPNCGEASYSGKHKISIEGDIITVVPSIVMQCCFWHGHLKNGYFEE